MKGYVMYIVCVRKLNEPNKEYYIADIPTKKLTTNRNEAISFDIMYLPKAADIDTLEYFVTGYAPI